MKGGTTVKKDFLILHRVFGNPLKMLFYGMIKVEKN